VLALENRTFELYENEHGHASGNTVMVFGSASEPQTGTYTGPNVMYGQVIVVPGSSTGVMLYHALTMDGDLVAGRATVSVQEHAGNPAEMRLDWQWLTGDQSSGTSVWREVNPD
jgi:hypothetical protein